MTGESDLVSVVREFSLNKDQTRAFRIICSHALTFMNTVPSMVLNSFV